MSKYTTEVRFIVETINGLTESKGYKSTASLISGALSSIFDFDYPIFDEYYRVDFETKILRHFYTREIGEETVGLWKFRLETKLNEIMPYYNKLYQSTLLEFNPLYATDITKTETHTLETNNTTNTTGTTTSSSNSKSKDLYSDTPQGGLSNVESGTYLTDARIIDGNNTGQMNVQDDSKGTVNTSETYINRVQGYEGWNPGKLLKDFRESLVNVDLLVMNELETLFIQLW